MNLHRTPSSLTREDRNKLNENWGLLEQEIIKIGPAAALAQLAKLSAEQANTGLIAANKRIDTVAGEAADIAYEQVVGAAKLIWKAPVVGFSDLAATYLEAQEGWTAQSTSDGSVYRFDGAAWKKIQQVDAGPINEVDSRLTAKMVETSDNLQYNTSGLQPIPASGVSASLATTQPMPIDIIDGLLVGQVKGEGLYRKDVNDGAWSFYTNKLPQINTTIIKLIPTVDGEVLVVYASHIYKSLGWQTGAPTWNLKLQPYGATFFYHFNVDGDGNKFIASSYSGVRPDSRYVYISLDAGDSFNVAYDAVAVHGQTAADGSHLHGMCYDKYRNRFYLAEGHGTNIAGIYCSVDDGQTWFLAQGMKKDASPTTITATPTGLVCGSDSADAGVFGVVSLDDITKQELVPTWGWDSSRDGVLGFGYSARYDETTNLVFIGFTVDWEELSPVIVAGTPFSAGLVYKWTTSGSSFRRGIDKVVTYKNRFWSSGFTATEFFNITGKINVSGVKTFSKGNAEYGAARLTTSLAIGSETVTNGLRSTLIGHGINQSSLTSADMVAIGYKSKVLGTGATAIGQNTEAQGASTVVGNNAKAPVGISVAIGEGSATAGGSGGVAIGNNTIARGDSVSIGRGAKSADGGIRTIAIGKDTVAHTDSVAIGDNLKTSRGQQYAIGEKHFEVKATAEQNTGAVAAGYGRLFFRVNSTTGKVELCAQFQETSPVVLAAQL